MKRFLVVVLSLLAVALLPTSALATHNPPTSPGPPTVTGPPFPPRDFIHAVGQAPLASLCGNVNHYFTIWGERFGPSTNSAAPGSIFWKFIPAMPCLGLINVTIVGDITCLEASGPTSATNAANWFGRINIVLFNGIAGSIPGVLAPGMGVAGRVVDNWDIPPPPPAVPPDRESEFVTPTPLSCFSPFLFATFSTLPINSSSLAVHAHDGIVP